MPKTYKITTEQAAEVAKVRESNRDKQVDKRLRAVQLRGEGKENHEIAKMLETSSDIVSRWVSMYAKEGYEALLAKKRQGNHRNLSYEEEKAMLETFQERADAGQIIEVSEIEQVYQERVGHPIGGGQIYRVLKRHNWRKVKPRSRHPKKASEEAIEASKKLTHAPTN